MPSRTFLFHSLIGMLLTVEGTGGSELQCGSHVDRLLTKLPLPYRDSLIEHCLNRGILKDGAEQTCTLEDFSAWLQLKARAKSIAQQVSVNFNGATRACPEPRGGRGCLLPCTLATQPLWKASLVSTRAVKRG